MHILGVYVHIPARYEVSMINAITGTAVHRQHQWWWWWQWRHQWVWTILAQCGTTSISTGFIYNISLYNLKALTRPYVKWRDVFQGNYDVRARIVHGQWHTTDKSWLYRHVCQMSQKPRKVPHGLWVQVEWNIAINIEVPIDNNSDEITEKETKATLNVWTTWLKRMNEVSHLCRR